MLRLSWQYRDTCSKVGCANAARMRASFTVAGRGEAGITAWCGSLARILPSDAVCMRIASASHPALCQRFRAAARAASIRAGRFAAQGLCSAQSCMTYNASLPSKKPSCAIVVTKAPDSPAQSAAISRSSAVSPARSPSGRLSATQAKRQRRAHAPLSPSRRRTFTVFGCRGNAVEILRSSAT